MGLLTQHTRDCFKDKEGRRLIDNFLRSLHGETEVKVGKLCKNVFEDDKIEDEPKRKKGKKLKYSLNEDVYISFDLNGYIIEAKGFGFLMWSSNIDIDKELIGKHIDELSKMLDKNCISREVYLRFETDVHVALLKEMLQYKGAIDD